jgi:serine protease Do
MQDSFTDPAIKEQPAPVQVQGSTPAKWRKGTLWIVVVVLVVISIGSLAIILSALSSRLRASAPELPPPAPRTVASSPSPNELSQSFRDIAKAIKPAVVNINVTENAPSTSPFSDFFRFDTPQGRRARPSTGSGFIVTPDGYILTNEHVVGHADQIEVTLSDNRRLKARVIGLDQESDLAVIKIDATGLPIVVLGNSDDVEQGDWVLALGSPFGLSQTLTAGIVSATGREIANAPQYSKFIQTDASINPGNSGGPLVSMHGEVIGINTMILSGSSQGNVGIGFAIASNIVRKVFAELAKAGKVTRGFLGVEVGPVDAATARSLCIDSDLGAMVSKVVENSPAALAGLRGGDVITSFNGTRVKAPRELTDAVAETEVGKSVSVEYMRNCQSHSVTVQVAERPTNVNARQQQQPEPAQPEEARAGKLGIFAQNITEDMAARGRLEIRSGALVTSVQSGSVAELAGIQHGDVIHRVDRTEVRTAADLVSADQSLKSGDEVALMIERGRQIRSITVTVP